MHLSGRGTPWIRRFAPAVALGAVALLLAVTPASAQVGEAAAWVGNKVGVGLAEIFGWVLSLLISVVGHLMIVVTKIFIWAVQYSDFIYNGTVTIGWEIVRDLSNMFFVVAILAIAWATILQLETYGYRRLLAKLLLMAVLVNFSKFIAGVVIDLGQIIILTFAQATVGGISASSLYIKLGVGDLVGFSSRITEADATGQAFELVGTLLFGFILLVIAFGVILAYTLIFTFRIVALWILIILSPLAFLLAAFPAGQGYSRQWWSSFTRYVFTGVIIMFFFWLALVTSQSAFTILSPELVKEEQEKLLTVAGSKMGSPINLSRFIITVSFLIAGLVAAQKAGVAGSSFAGDLLNRGRRAVSTTSRWLAGRPTSLGGWAARKIKAGQVSLGIPGTKVQFNLGKYTKGLDLNVMNWVRGYKESREEKKLREEGLGRKYSGEALKRGGIAGTFKGLGAGRDFFDAYIKGFLNVEGFQRLGRGVVGKYVMGGARGAGGVMVEVRKEQNELKRLERNEARRKRMIDKKDFHEEGIEAYVEDKAEIKDRKGALAAARTPGSDLEKQYYKEYLISRGVEDDKERDRLAKLKPADAEYATWFGGDAWKKFIEAKDEDLVKKQLRAEAVNKVKEGTDTTFLADLNTRGQRHMERLEREAQEEYDRMIAGGYSNSDADKIQFDVGELYEELKKIDADIRAAGGPGSPKTAVLEDRKVQLENEIANRAYEVRDPISGAVTGYRAKKLAKDLTAKQVEENLKKYQGFDAKKGQTEEDSMLAIRREQLEDLKSRGHAPKISTDDREWLRYQSRAAEQEAKERHEKLAKLKERAEYWEAPHAFYADEGYQRLIREQMGKITAQNADELNAAFRSAQRDGDRIKASAIAMKMAKDSNDNELWNDHGFDSDSEGKHAFFDAVMIGKKGVKMGDGSTYTGPSFNMSEQEAYSLENAIDYINEDINHWETARTMKMENGFFRRMTEEEHASAALAEIMKRNTREITRAYNRLAYGGEHVVDRATGAREFKPAQLGKAILMALGAEIAQNVARGEYNKNAVTNLGTWAVERGGADELRRRKIDERYLSRLEAIYRTEKSRGTTSAADTIVRLFHGSY